MRRLLAVLLLCLPAFGGVEDRSAETRSFPGGRLVILDNVNGSIEATAYNGNDVRVEISKRIEAETPERLEAAKREVKLDIQQSGETVKLFVDGPFRCHCGDGASTNWSHHEGYTVQYDFKLRVPASARLDLYTVNHGDIAVTGAGDFDIRNVNGRIDMTDISGSGRAHTVNGAVKVAFARNPTAASGFETVNGNVDVTFRKGLSADVRMRTMHGEMYTDFTAATLPAQTVTPENSGGKFVYRRGADTGIRIGTGGTEIKLKTLNGDIFVRNRDKQ